MAHGAIILAAGLSSRMVSNKLLLPWTDGVPIIRRVAERYTAYELERIIVVTGRDAAEVRACLAGLPLSFTHNPAYATGGMLSSVQAGLRALPRELDAAFIQPGDMPCVPRAVIGRLLAAHEPGVNVAPAHEGQRGHPVLLDRASWGRMLGLHAGAKPKDALGRARLVEVEDAGVLLDVDTQEAYERALKRGC